LSTSDQPPGRSLMAQIHSFVALHLLISSDKRRTHDHALPFSLLFCLATEASSSRHAPASAHGQCCALLICADHDIELQAQRERSHDIVMMISGASRNGPSKNGRGRGANWRLE